MRRGTSWTIVGALAALGAGCGGGGKYLGVAQARAQGERPSVEVALDRLEDVRVLGQQLDDLTTRTPVGAGAPWAARLDAIPADRAMALGEQARNRAPYDLVGTRVSLGKIYVLYNDEVLAAAAEYTGDLASVMDAVSELGVGGANKIKAKYEAVRTNRSEMAEIEGTIEGLEAEADRATTPDRRRNVIATQIASSKQKLAQLAESNAPSEKALFMEIAALRAHGPLNGETRPLAASLFSVAQHAARMEEEAQVTTQLAVLELDRAAPTMEQELQSMGERLVVSAARELGLSEGATRSARITVYADGGIYSSVAVSGLSPADTGPVQQSLMRRFDIIKDQIAAARATAATGDAMSRFEHDFFRALAEALGALSGLAYTPAPALPLPEIRAFAGGPAAPAPTGWETPAPAAPSAPSPQPSAAPLPAPQPAPTAPGVPVPPPPPGPEPQPSLECPPALCGGVISSNGVGKIALKMSGRDAATAIERRLAPKKDATHAQPSQNIGGVVLTFCGDQVCRVEVTVNPPVTAEGVGVDTKLSLLAKKYGQSKCQPVDAARFGIEFERLPGVFWISDKLDCEGIEDLDFWDRPLQGTVTTVIVGTMQN
jgi:hypothetical protein